MGRFLDMLRGTAGESSLSSALARWRQALSRSVDALEPGRWITQATWNVSPTGSDSATGLTAGSAIRTLGELTRRWTGGTFDPSITTVTVNLLGDFQSEDLVLPASFARPTVVNVAGTMQQQAAGHVGIFTPFNPAGGVRSTIVDATMDFTGQGRRRLRLTSGTNAGAVTWILSLTNPTTARIGQFRLLSPANVSITGLNGNPSNGDAYVVETPITRIRSYTITCPGPVLVNLSDMAVAPVDTALVACSSRLAFGLRLFGVEYVTDGVPDLTLEGDHYHIPCSIRGANLFEVYGGEHAPRGLCVFRNLDYYGATVVSRYAAHDGNGIDPVTLHVKQNTYLLDTGHRSFFGAGNEECLVEVAHDAQWEPADLVWGSTGNLPPVACEVENTGRVMYWPGAQPVVTAAVPGNDVALSNEAPVAWAVTPRIATPPNNAYVIEKTA